MIKKNRAVVLIRISVICILIVCIAFLTYNRKADSFTEEQHIQRVTERIKARYIDGDETIRPYNKPIDEGKIYPNIKPTDFTIYPIYNENDEFEWCLVEFEPFGFLFVWIRDEQLKGFSWLGASTSMYMRSATSGEPPWSRYTIDETNSQPWPDTDICWETDENGERIMYNRSPYSVANIENEKRYLLRYGESYNIPAVKRTEGYLNLISMEMINNTLDKQPYTYYHAINKKHFDL